MDLEERVENLEQVVADMSAALSSLTSMFGKIQEMDQVGFNRSMMERLASLEGSIERLAAAKRE